MFLFKFQFDLDRTFVTKSEDAAQCVAACLVLHGSRRTELMSEMNSATAGRGRRMSLPPVIRQPVIGSHTASVSSHQRRRGSVYVQSNTPQLHPSTDDDDDDDAAVAAADAELLSEMYSCHNQLSQLLTAVTQLEVRITAVRLWSFLATSI